MMQTSSGVQFMIGAWCLGYTIAFAGAVTVVATPVIVGGLVAAGVAAALADAP